MKVSPDVRVGYPPCMNCEERHDLCHSHCEKYIKWKARHDEVKQLDNEYKYRRNAVDDYEVDRLNKYRKRRRQI